MFDAYLQLCHHHGAGELVVLLVLLALSLEGVMFSFSHGDEM